ncbi:class II aldolase/adducin family protein [Rhodobacteraceae bacterium]|nr:class II aldolase/adducin family protein [Paracoccaceae bacterium]
MLRAEIIAQCLAMNEAGLNHGVSGNISARCGDRMLITPSGTDYTKMTREMIASIDLGDPEGAFEGPLKPSSEWRFHHAIMAARSDVNSIVHAHPIYCTALAMARKPIPAAHYMVAIFGGADVRCSGYATFGTKALSDEALAALDGRTACLLANHGMIALGATLDQAMWRATELEVLAHQYCVSLTIGGPVILDDAAIDETLVEIATYGKQDV